MPFDAQKVRLRDSPEQQFMKTDCCYRVGFFYRWFSLYIPGSEQLVKFAKLKVELSERTLRQIRTVFLHSYPFELPSVKLRNGQK